MRAPAAFVVARHRLTHPDEGPAAIARHCGLHDATVRAAARRLDEQDLWHDESLLHWLQGLAERPKQKRLYFKIPSPEQFMRTLTTSYWLSGEFAAAAEGYDLVPEKLLIYVKPDDVDEVSRLALNEFAKVAAPSAANLIIAIPDRWMYLDPASPLAERGQRLIDYAESRHIQILKGLRRG